MGKFISLFLKIGTLIILVSFNSFAGGLEVSRQNNMILFSEGKTVNFSSRQTSSTVTDNVLHFARQPINNKKIKPNVCSI